MSIFSRKAPPQPAAPEALKARVFQAIVAQTVRLPGNPSFYLAPGDLVRVEPDDTDLLARCLEACRDKPAERPGEGTGKPKRPPKMREAG